MEKTITQEKDGNKVSEFAAEMELPFMQFAGRCLMRNLSYQTAKDIWYKTPRKNGYNRTTKAIVARILHRPVDEVFTQPPA